MTIRIKRLTEEDSRGMMDSFTEKFEEYETFDVEELIIINNDIYFQDWRDEDEDR